MTEQDLPELRKDCSDFLERKNENDIYVEKSKDLF